MGTAWGPCEVSPPRRVWAVLLSLSCLSWLSWIGLSNLICEALERKEAEQTLLQCDRLWGEKNPCPAQQKPLTKRKGWLDWEDEHHPLGDCIRKTFDPNLGSQNLTKPMLSHRTHRFKQSLLSGVYWLAVKNFQHIIYLIPQSDCLYCT